MRPSILASLLGLVCVVPALPAAAGELGDGHTVILSAERLTGVEHATVSTGGATSQGTTNVYLFGNIASTTPFSVPRLALDYVAVDHFTVGGAAMVFHQSRSASGSSASTDTTVYTASLRLGGIAALAPNVSLWGRAGVSYYHIGSAFNDTGSPTETVTASGVGLDLEAMLVFKLVDHLGLSVSGLADIALSGSQQMTGGTSQELKYTNYGGTAGIVGWF